MCFFCISYNYVRGTLDYGLQLYSSSTSSLVAYSDADWAGCPTTRRSTSGYCVFLGNNLLSWSSKRQFTLSRSSAEAEYRGVANAVAETSWLRNLLRELHSPLSTATLVYCDNVSAVYLSSNPVQHQRTKHIEIDIHFVRDLVAMGHIRVLHVPSRYQYADIFTKGLPTALFDEFRSSLSVRSSLAPTAGGSWFLWSLILRLLAENKKDHRSLAQGCESETNSGVRWSFTRTIPLLYCPLISLHYDGANNSDDPMPATSSFSMANVRRLSAHVVKLRDMPEGVMVLSGLSRVWKSCVCDPVLRGVNGNVMGIHYFLCLPEWTGDEVQEEPILMLDPTPEDLAIGTPSSKILAKAEASQKRKAFTSGATSSHVAKRTRSALAQSSGSTTRPSLFVGDDDGSDDDDDDDACVEIPLVTPLHSVAVIPSSGNQGSNSVTPVAEGSNPRDSRGKGIMADDVAAPSIGVNRPRPSSGPVPSFRDVSGDAIHLHFFPLVLTKEVFKDPAVCKTVVDQFPTSGEMVRVESLSGDQLTVKMSVLHCMMMSHGGELLDRYRRLNQSHHEAT
ncbi:ribonuclease H-like domain-containing protein [Tanacetum coccineum]